jgi:hypothetical protein
MAIQNWKYDRRRRITLALLNDGRELALPRLAPIKIWLIKSAIKREVARMWTKAEGAD